MHHQRRKERFFKEEKPFYSLHGKMFNNWCDNGIAARSINEFSKKSRICELHFQKDNILREDIFHMADGATITVQRKVSKLKEDVVPSEIISCYCLNLINEEQQKEQQNGETSITTQLKNTVNCFVFVPAKCKSDNLISHYEQDCSVNADNKLQTWPEIKTNLKSLILTSEYWIPVITDEMAMWVYWKEDLSSYIWRVILEKNMTFRVSIYH